MAAGVDGGYAWVVLVASFVADMITGLLVTTVSVLTPAIVDALDTDITRASWVSSTLLGTAELFGPLAGMIGDSIGLRKSGIAAGVLLLVGLTGAFFCHTVTGLILTFGVITGVGTGLGMNLSGVAPGYFFVKRMTVAYGIVQTGGGVGLFIMGPLLTYLLGRYGLHGTFLILGGIGFQLCVVGALIRPNPTQDLEIEIEVDDPKTEEADACEGTKYNGLQISVGERDSEKALVQHDPLIDDAKLHEISCASQNNEVMEKVRYISESPNVSSCEYTALTSTRHDNDKYIDEDRNNFEENELVKLEISKVESADLTIGEKVVDSLTNTYRILGINGFYLYVLSSFLWSIGEWSCVVHLPNYVEHRGSTPSQSAALLTGMGIASIVSGVLSGFIASDKNIGNIVLNFGFLGVSGLLCILFPLLSGTFELQMVFSSLYGLYSQALYTLCGPICIQLVGVSNLAVAYGICSCSNGLGSLVGPPIASLIYTASGNYDLTFIFAGISQILAALLVATVPMAERKKVPVSTSL